MGANDSKSRPDGYQTHYQPNTRQSHAYYTIATPHGPQTTNKPRQQQQQQQQPRSNAGFTQPQRPAAANSPSGAVHTQNRQTLQQPRQQTPRQTPNQSARQSSQGQPQQNTKPKKQSLSEVVQSLKQILEGYDGHRFTLEGIDALYRVMKGESIPYTAHGFPSLSSFIESKCDFLTIFTGADGTTQILLRPPSYQEAVNHPMSSTSVAANLQVKHNVSALVHDEISLTDFNRLKIISETKARNGITIQEFENLYFAEFQTRIDFKGFSRAAFFHGLDDIVETREDRDGIKLYTKSGCQNAPKTPQKSSAPQTAANKSQHNAGNKGQPSPGKKNHHSGGQKPQNGNNNRHPSKQHEQHQPRAQQSQNRSHSRQRDAKPKVELTPFYEKELRKMLQQCKAPGGVTPKAFKQYFREHSSLHFCTYDVSDEEFFSALPHIFQINRGPNGIRLMPTPLSTGLARNNFSNWQSTSVLEGTPTRASREKVSASVGNLSAACSMHMLMGGRCLWIVSIENYEYVPTGCVAKLANMAKDTVINDLRKHSLEIRYIKKLEDQDIKKVLVNNNVARADEVVMTIPLKSVPIILRAFLGRDVDDAFMANLEEVSKEHVRNKRFGRPNRQ